MNAQVQNDTTDNNRIKKKLYSISSRDAKNYADKIKEYYNKLGERLMSKKKTVDDFI